MEKSSKIVVITGPFGSGKTTVSNFLAATLRSAGRAVRIVPLDEVSREVINDDTGLRDDLAAAFGDHILNDDSSLDRAALAELAFADDSSTARLNKLVHPPTIARAQELIADALEVGELPIIEMPFPASYMSEVFQFDVDAVVWTVVSDKETRLERGLADGFSLEDALRRMDRQPRISAYEMDASVVLQNDHGLADLRLEVQMCLEQSPL
ncbi:MAG: dephospho-CoA kinase [Coriobacteriia bacterium]|nr:dephospho-CoA kinase [Coriobacteriia bacterium]MCL2537377.1 dephospho-CoA kinase [Coriobacteriia bacterium]